VQFLAVPPWWLPWCILVSGLTIIWADSRYRIKAATYPGAAPDVTLTMESNLADLPSRCPQEGQIASLRLFYHPESGVTEPIGFIIKHCRPGEDIQWFPDLKFPQIYRCEVTNYGSSPLLQVGLNFNIDYREVLREEGITRQGGTVRFGMWPVLLPKIDPGKTSAAVFYVYNESDYFARVTPPTVASYIDIKDKKHRQASLLHIGMVAGMSLSPVERA
jgi:hypothetical protein